MLGHPSIQRYSSTSHPFFRVAAWVVKIRLVRTISRKLSVLATCSIPTGWLDLWTEKAASQCPCSETRCCVLRAASLEGQAERLRSICRHRAVDAEEGASVQRWVRAAGAPCVWHECQWQAAFQEYRASTCRILRDCTWGSLTNLKIQSQLGW